MNCARLTPAASGRVNESTIIWLTTLRADGSPHTTPVWFVCESSHLRVRTGLRNVKARNVKNDSRVTAAIDGTSDAPLVAQGTAHLMDLAAADSSFTEAFSQKYEGWDVHDTSVDGPRVLLKIIVSRWLLRG